MKKAIISVFVFVLCFLFGCAWFSPKNPDSSHKSKNFDDLKSTPYILSGKILDATRLQEGGSLLIIPFKAGAGVESTGELDNVALMIVRGISDAFKESSSNFKILDADHADQADFIIKGHITGRGKSSRWKRWVLLKDKNFLRVNGKLIDVKTEKTILVFSDKKEGRKKRDEYKLLGHMVGQNIGRFILNAIP
jgi:hypothetical protein